MSRRRNPVRVVAAAVLLAAATALLLLSPTPGNAQTVTSYVAVSNFD